MTNWKTLRNGLDLDRGGSVPNRMLKPCSYPGCPNLVTSGRCAEHAGIVQPGRQRDADIHLLYDRQWQARRRKYLSLHPWCENCLSHDLYVPATDVHHKIPHRGDKDLFRTSPLESLCHSCHSAETAKENRGTPSKSFEVGGVERAGPST